MNPENKKMTPTEFLQQKKVFFVGSPKDDTVLVAINPRFDEESKTLYWWDSVKERTKKVENMEVGEQPVLNVLDNQDNSYFFIPLNLELYNGLVKDKLSGKREFTSEEEMVKAFEETVI